MRNFYHILIMDKCSDSYGEALIFSTLDTNQGSWPIESDDAYCDEEEFTLYNRLYRIERMPFGMQYAPGKFQWPMIDIESLVRW